MNSSYLYNDFLKHPYYALASFNDGSLNLMILSQSSYCCCHESKADLACTKDFVGVMLILHKWFVTLVDQELTTANCILCNSQRCIAFWASQWKDKMRHFCSSRDYFKAQPNHNFGSWSFRIQTVLNRIVLTHECLCSGQKLLRVASCGPVMAKLCIYFLIWNLLVRMKVI